MIDVNTELMKAYNSNRPLVEVLTELLERAAQEALGDCDVCRSCRYRRTHAAE